MGEIEPDDTIWCNLLEQYVGLVDDVAQGNAKCLILERVKSRKSKVDVTGKNK